MTSESQWRLLRKCLVSALFPCANIPWPKTISRFLRVATLPSLLSLKEEIFPFWRDEMSIFLTMYLMMFLYWKYLHFFFLNQTFRIKKIFFHLEETTDTILFPLLSLVMKKWRSNNFSSLTDLEASLGWESSSDPSSSPTPQPHVFLSLTHRLFLATSKHTDLWNMERKALWNKTGTNSG